MPEVKWPNAQAMDSKGCYLKGMRFMETFLKVTSRSFSDIYTWCLMIGHHCTWWLLIPAMLPPDQNSGENLRASIWPALLYPSTETLQPLLRPENAKLTPPSLKKKGYGRSGREIMYSTKLPGCTLLIPPTMTCTSPGFSSSAPIITVDCCNKLSCGSWTVLTEQKCGRQAISCSKDRNISICLAHSEKV